MAEIDATAVHFLYDFVRGKRERRRLDPVTNLEGPAPIEVVFGNPSKQVVREMEHADLVNFIGASEFRFHNVRKRCTSGGALVSWYVLRKLSVC